MNEKPQTDVIQNDDLEPHAVERLKNIRNTQAGDEATVGKDTVGQGLPQTQAVKQEESLPPVAVPVDQNFKNVDEFYNPLEMERAEAAKNSANDGGKKTPE